MSFRGIDAYSFGPLAAMYRAIAGGQVLRFKHEDAESVAVKMAQKGFDVRIDKYVQYGFSTVRLR